MQVYKSADDYVHGMDTFYVECFNNAVLQYHDKRINFTDETYVFRTNIGILDWNENVNRPVTSVKQPADVCSRKKTATKVLKKKTFNWWETIWARFSDHCLGIQ